MATVAVLGTGIMGSGMARSLRRAGHDVQAWNRTRSKAEPLASDGVVVCDTAADAARGAGFVLTMLRDAPATEEVMGDVLEVMDGSSLWLQMATVGVEGIERLASLAAASGVTLVDAPVSGSRQPAEQGTLAVLASGSPAVRDRCAPVFDAVGSRTVWVGDGPGPASRFKLVVNNWVEVVLGGVAETLALADALGLHPALFLDFIEGGPLGVPYARLKGDLMLRRDYPPAFTVALTAKDNGLIRDAAEGVGLALPIAAAVGHLLGLAAERGHADDDMAAVYEAVAPGQ